MACVYPSLFLRKAFCNIFKTASWWKSDLKFEPLAIDIVKGGSQEICAH